MELNRNFTRRLGLGLMSASGNPAGDRGIALMNAQEAEQQALAQQDEAKAEQLKRDSLLKIYQEAVRAGADEDTQAKILDAAGVQVPPGALGGIVGGAKQKRFIDTLKAADFDAESINEAIQAGFDPTKLRAVQSPSKTERPSVLNPGGQLRSPTGELLAENTNVRPGSAPRVTDQQRRMQSVESRRSEVQSALESDPNKLSNRFAASRLKVDENVALGLTTPSNGDKMKAELDKRRETLIRYDNAAERATQILAKNPTAATVGADTAKAMISLAANAQGLLNVLPFVDVRDVDLDEGAWGDKLTEIAGDNAELRTTMFNLGIQLAVADGLATGRLSNQQLQLALDNIGASGRSPAAIRRKLAEVRTRVAESLDIALDGVLEDFSALDRPDPTQPEPARPADVPEVIWNVMTPEEKAVFQ